MFLKKLIPTTLFNRFLLIIVIPTIIVQIVAVYVFYYAHVDRISKYMASSLVREMRFFSDAVSQNYDSSLTDLLAENLDMKFSVDKTEKLTTIAKVADKSYKSPINAILPIIDSLNRFKIELNSYGLTPFAIYKNAQDDERLIVKIESSFNEGVLTFDIPKTRVTNSSKTLFIIWLLTASFLTTFISIIFLKNQIASIKGLSKATEKFGRGQDVSGFKPSGAQEIRSVGLSFIKMKQRIARQLSQRTDMLSGVSHDLRTPLTRMKLQLELMKSDQATEDLKSDISDMEKMVNEYLEFAKGGQKENNQDVVVSDFLNKIIQYYKQLNKTIINEVELPENFTINIRKNSMKRVIRNLIDNAFNYGDKVILTTNLTSHTLKIIVEDNGCGVPTKELKNIFKPFYRVDSSRNLDKIGTGLGLAIVLDIISFHGGTVEAQKSQMGGLKIVISLPI